MVRRVACYLSLRAGCHIITPTHKWQAAPAECGPRPLRDATSTLQTCLTSNCRGIHSAAVWHCNPWPQLQDFPVLPMRRLTHGRSHSRTTPTPHALPLCQLAKAPVPRPTLAPAVSC